MRVLTQQIENGKQLSPNPGDACLALFVFFVNVPGFNRFPRPLNGKAQIVEQVANFADGLNVAASIDTLSGAALSWGNRGELRFPVAQYVGLHAGKAADFPNAEHKLAGNLG